MKIYSSKSFVFIICISLILDWNVAFAEKKDSEKGKRFRIDFSKLSPACFALGATVGVVGIPAALWATGFGASGIATGSIASKLMSWTALYYGGGVPATSMVAGLQSAGAAGVYYLTTGAASALAAIGCEMMEVDDEDTDDEGAKDENRHEEEENRYEEEENRYEEEENRYEEEENRYEEEENRYEEQKNFQKSTPDNEANQVEKEAANPQESIPHDTANFVEQFLVVFYFFVTLMAANQETSSYGKIMIIFSAITLLGLIFKLLREFLLHFLAAFCFFAIFKGVQILRQCIPQQG